MATHAKLVCESEVLMCRKDVRLYPKHPESVSSAQAGERGTPKPTTTQVIASIMSAHLRTARSALLS